MRLRQAGLEIEARVSADYTFEGGAAAARQMLTEGRLDALLCANDAMALGALTVLRQEMNVTVPDDLSIVGFDDIGMASWPCFNLTTVRNPIEETVERILELLMARLSAPTLPGKVAYINPVLIERQTH